MNNPHEAHERCRAALSRLAERYKKAIDRVCIHEGRTGVFCNTLRTEVREWFSERHIYLQEVYRQELNKCDSIIAGKQLIFDGRPLLHHDSDIPKTSNYRYGNEFPAPSLG